METLQLAILFVLLCLFGMSPRPVKIVFIVIAIGAFVVWGIRVDKAGKQAASRNAVAGVLHQGHNHYTKVLSTVSSETAHAYLKGKAITFGNSHNNRPAIGIDRPIPRCMEDYRAIPSGPVEDIFWMLPSSLQALSTEEVQTIVLVEWANEVIAHYRGVSTARQAIRQVCQVTVVDTTVPAVTATRVFKGTIPATPKSTAPNDPALVGSDPSQEVAEWLVQLPSKPTPPK